MKEREVKEVTGEVNAVNRFLEIERRMIKLIDEKFNQKELNELKLEDVLKEKELANNIIGVVVYSYIWKYDYFIASYHSKDGNEIKTMRDIFNIVTDMLEKKSEIRNLPSCYDCGYCFLSGEGAYRNNDCGDYLCPECWNKEYPKLRDWLERICLDEWYEGRRLTQADLNKMTDDELLDTSNEISDSPCYYTEAYTIGD